MKRTMPAYWEFHVIDIRLEKKVPMKIDHFLIRNNWEKNNNKKEEDFFSRLDRWSV